MHHNDKSPFFPYVLSIILKHNEKEKIIDAMNIFLCLLLRLLLKETELLLLFLFIMTCGR